MICFLTKDLMMSSNASSHARQKDIKLSTAGSIKSAITFIEENKPQLLIIDLQTPGLDVGVLGEEVKELADSICPLPIAYAQHVNVELLEQAKSAGFAQVLTRGQFNAQVGKIIADIGPKD